MVIHAALLVAVQAQPAAAVTVTEPVAPAAATLAEAGEIVGAHVAPAWMTVKVLPPMVSVPVRDWCQDSRRRYRLTEPLPLPVSPAVMVIHAALLVAVQAQPVAVGHGDRCCHAGGSDVG